MRSMLLVNLTKIVLDLCLIFPFLLHILAIHFFHLFNSLLIVLEFSLLIRLLLMIELTTKVI